MNNRKDIENALDDTWVTLSPTLDMNIYTDSNGQVRFSIYPVFEGNTQIQFALATGLVDMNYEENK